jgi:hypothetical protein
MCRNLHTGGDRAAVLFVLPKFSVGPTEYLLSSAVGWLALLRALNPLVRSSHMGMMFLAHTLPDALLLLHSAYLLAVVFAVGYWVLDKIVAPVAVEWLKRKLSEPEKKPRSGRR